MKIDGVQLIDETDFGQIYDIFSYPRELNKTSYCLNQTKMKQFNFYS